MPSYYWYHCDTCDYRAERYRNVRRCKCGGNLIREEPQASSNRIVIEVYDDMAWGRVLAERPDEIVVIMRPLQGGYDLIYGGDDGLSIELLPVMDGASRRALAGVDGGTQQITFEVKDGKSI
jgi:hypothetical protein